MTGNERGGKLLPVVLFVLAVTSLLGFAIAPFIQLPQLNDELAQNRTLLAGLQALLSIAEGGPAGPGDPASFLLPGTTTGVAGANLQKLVNTVISDHDGTASSFHILPPQEDGDMVRLALGVSVSVDIDGLRDILHAIETSAPLVFVDDITVRVPQSAMQDPDPHYLGPLEVTMQVSGYLLHNGAL